MKKSLFVFWGLQTIDNRPESKKGVFGRTIALGNDEAGRGDTSEHERRREIGIVWLTLRQRRVREQWFVSGKTLEGR